MARAAARAQLLISRRRRRRLELRSYQSRTLQPVPIGGRKLLAPNLRQVRAKLRSGDPDCSESLDRHGVYRCCVVPVRLWSNDARVFANSSRQEDAALCGTTRQQGVNPARDIPTGKSRLARNTPAGRSRLARKAQAGNLENRARSDALLRALRCSSFVPARGTPAEQLLIWRKSRLMSGSAAKSESWKGLTTGHSTKDNPP